MKSRDFRKGAYILCIVFISAFGFIELFLYRTSSSISAKGSWYSATKTGVQTQFRDDELAVNLTARMVGLLASNNQSSSNIISLKTWEGFKGIVNRSDLSAAVVGSFREGLLAWERLFRIVAEEETRRKENESKQCPYSLSLGNDSEISGGMRLVFPCGLILGSSITVVATPLPGALEFQIQLIGVSEAGGPPVIFLYRVRPLGDKDTDQGVIIQNTWTSETDWEGGERCPGSGLPQVDGFDRCGTRLGICSTSNPGVGARSWWRPHRSTGSEIITKPWFPFVEGKLFLATIWVGAEGFHVSVDGEPITSFRHSKGVKPRLVGRMEVQGDLQPESIFASGLPITKRRTDVRDAEFLKAPSLSPMTKKLALFIGVLSSSGNFDQRMAVRRTWMQYPVVRSGDVAVRFFVALDKDEQVNKDVWEEANMFGDIQLLPFMDSYNLLILKTLAICIFAIQHANTGSIMKTDDDTFVRVDAVLSLLWAKKEAASKKSFIIGDIEANCFPNRDRTHKCYLSKEEWPDKVFPPWAHGPGYLISSDIAEFVSRISGSPQLKIFKLEDVGMGIWIEEYMRSKHAQVGFYQGREYFNSTGCCEGFITAHYQNPRKMLCIWNSMQKLKIVTCCD